MNKALSYTAGIYSTAATLINHRDGTKSLKYGYVKWTNTSGYLCYATTRLDDEQVEIATAAFAGEEFKNQHGDSYIMNGAELLAALGL